MYGCRELHGLSEYIITFPKMLVFSDDMLEIPSETIFVQGDISIFQVSILFNSGSN
jgi:hypothetical protein